MTDASRPAPRGLVYSIPVIGWFARDLAHDFKGNAPYLLVILATLLILAIKTWGLVALGLTALAMVPVMFTILILITVGK